MFPPIVRSGLLSRKHDKGADRAEVGPHFFVISLVAGYFGFTGVASGARSIAKVFFFIAIAIFLIILIFGVFLGMLVF